MNAVPIEEINQSVTRLRKMAAPDAMTFGGHRPPSLEPKYEVTVKDKMLYHAITVQPAYENYRQSFFKNNIFTLWIFNFA